MENEVKDAILQGTTDEVLASLLELTVHSVTTGRELFTTPLAEPVLYRRHFKKWVIEALGELNKIRSHEKEIKETISVAS